MLTEPGEKSYGARLWASDDYAKDRALCLEFANTVSWRGKPEPTEYLTEPASWLKWVADNKLVSDAALSELQRRSTMWPSELEGAHRRAVEFREALYNLLVRFSQGGQPDRQDEAAVQEVLDDALEELKLQPGGKPWRWRLETTGVDWNAALYPIALSAAQLLTSGWSERLSVCEREECRWLFLDLTKNHSRKWCSMDTCGNVIKARRHYARVKKG